MPNRNAEQWEIDWIRTEVQGAIESGKTAKEVQALRWQFAEITGLTRSQVGSICAWKPKEDENGNIILSLEVTRDPEASDAIINTDNSVIADEEKTLLVQEAKSDETDAVSTVDSQRLVHLQVMRDHFYFNHAKERPLERTLFELQKIFAAFYSTDEVQEMLQLILNEKPEDMVRVDLPDLDAKPGERVDYDNEKKNANRDWWMNLLKKHTQGVDKSKLNLLLLPGPECHELSPVIGMGFPPENIRTYNLGEDPAASAVFVRNCQEQGVFNWQLGDLGDLLPDQVERVHGGNLDFTGWYSRKDERVLSLIPLPKNGQTYFSINLQKRRERSDVTAEYRFVAFQSDSSKKIISNFGTPAYLEIKNQQVRHSMNAYKDKSTLQTSEARKRALEFLIQENIGAARIENWICANDIRQMVIATGYNDDYDQLDAYEKFRRAKKIMTALTSDLVTDLTDALEKSGSHPDLADIIAPCLQLMVRRCFNETEVIHSEQYEYCSPTGSPFISHFVVCENYHDHYSKMQNSIRFFIQCMEIFVKDISVCNDRETLEKIFSPTFFCEEIHFAKNTDFNVCGSGDNRKLVFTSSNNNLIAEISIVDLQADTNRLINFLNNHLLRTDKYSDTRGLIDEWQEEKENVLPEEKFLKNQTLPKRKVQKLQHGQIVSSVKVNRNDACPCGSGSKYKKCCGKAG